jgi:ketosteroid isomerase-like protein
MTQERKNLALAKSLLEHYQKNDHVGLLGLLTTDCEFRIGAGKSQAIVPYHGKHVGHQAITGYLQKRHQNSMRRNDECIREPLGGQPAPQAPDASESAQAAEFFAHGDTVVAMGHLTDRFHDGSHMHDSDYVLVFRIDEKQAKIRFFQYFFDTAGAMEAWRERKSQNPS